MVSKLDLWLFGNGHGLAQPLFDGRFYWLVDTSEGRAEGCGRLYTFAGWFGSQLRSFEWRMPRPGERRRLAGEWFTVFQAHRKGPRVEVAWAMRLPDEIDAAHAKIRALERRLGQMVIQDELDLEAMMRQERAWEEERASRRAKEGEAA